MKKKLLLASLLTISGLVLLHPYVYTNSNGAPAGNTGAPNERTCAQSGCHSGNDLNESGGTFNIRVKDNGTEVNEYQHGKTYTVEVDIAREGAAGFGFQATAKSGNTSAGTLSTGGNNDVQKISTYITHKNPAPHHSGADMWTFQWTAPTTGGSDITFYAAGNAANGNGTTTGDFIYTTSKTLTSSSVSVDDKTLFSSNMRVYPNPVQNILAVDFTLPESKANTAILQVFAADGKLVSTEKKEVKAFSANTIYADLSGFDKGIYLVKLSAGEFTAVKKVLKQ